MSNKQYRLNELMDPSDRHSLVLDTSNGLILGTLPGLEHFSEAVNPLLPLLDGIVTSPGQVKNLGLGTSQEATLIVRSDWTNALRSTEFVLPPETIQYLPILNIEDALDLGASALVMSFILGHEEKIEAECLKRVVHLSLDGLNLGMPLIVDVQPVGPRVVMRNKAIELGVSYALEGGSDGMAIPWPGPDSFETILGMTSGLPVWVKPNDLGKDSSELTTALRMGAAGLWLDERFLSVENHVEKLNWLHDLVHAGAVVK